MVVHLLCLHVVHLGDEMNAGIVFSLPRLSGGFWITEQVFEILLQLNCSLGNQTGLFCADVHGPGIHHGRSGTRGLGPRSVISFCRRSCFGGSCRGAHSIFCFRVKAE